MNLPDLVVAILMCPHGRVHLASDRLRSLEAATTVARRVPTIDTVSPPGRNLLQ